jgi:hypothetical protein
MMAQLNSSAGSNGNFRTDIVIDSEIGGSAGKLHRGTVGLGLNT